MHHFEQKADLAGRVAIAINSSWEEYWESASLPPDEMNALGRARDLYALAAQAQYERPEEWTDPMIDAAILMLLTLADGYLLDASEPAAGLPAGSRPTFAETNKAFVESGLKEWCDQRARPIEHPPRATGEVSPHDPPVEGLTDSVRLDVFVANGRTESDIVSVGDSTAAAELKAWMDLYPAWLADIQAEPLETLSRLRQRRAVWVQHLAWVRDTLPKYYALGATTEAIVALSLVVNIVRSLLLGGLARDVDELGTVYLLPLEELDRRLEEYGLRGWLDRAEPPRGT